VRRGRDPELPHQILRPHLRALDPGRRAGRAERAHADLDERVDDPLDERRLGADHDQVGAAVARDAHDPVDVLGADLEALDLVARDPGVAGRGEDLGPAWAAHQRAHERVLTPPAADDQDPAQATGMITGTR
jgi:hypothetical protein